MNLGHRQKYTSSPFLFISRIPSRTFRTRLDATSGLICDSIVIEEGLYSHIIIIILRTAAFAVKIIRHNVHIFAAVKP